MECCIFDQGLISSTFFAPYAPCANHRDSSFHLPWFALCAYAQLFVKFFTGVKVRREGVGCKKVYEIDPSIWVLRTPNAGRNIQQWTIFLQ